MLENLNKQQLEAVVSNSKYVRIVAGAGSGKTRVLTTRVAYLINELNVFPYRILAITFTNKAAREMKERITSILGDDGLSVNVSTIHALCVRILREDIEALGYPRNFTIIDTQDQRSILNEAYKDLEVDRKEYSAGALLSYISNNKTADISVENAFKMAHNNPNQLAYAKVYEYYQNRLKSLYALDFDDLLIFTNKMFLKYPEITNKWQKRFSHIHVDEFQDVDNIQYGIIKSLTGSDNSLYVVGDPDQTIYTWRGANVDIIMTFEKDFKNAHTVILNQNYRSTDMILKGANSIIVNNKNRVKKELFTEHESKDKILHYSGAGQEYEANWIAEKIFDLRKEGVDYRDIAILYRSNYLSRALEKGMLDYKIPYVIFGGTRFYDRQEVKDALSYLRMVVTGDDLAFVRVINNPRRGVGNKGMENIYELSRELDITLYEVVRDHNVLSGKAKNEAAKFTALIEEVKLMPSNEIDKILNKLLNESGYIKMLETSKEMDRLENLKELMNDIETYMKNNPEGTLEEYLQIISLYSDKEVYDTGSYTQLMTIHAAKGLEFDYVFVAGMSEGIFPSERTLMEGPSGLEEERRLAYVAYTRAKKQLFLTESSGFSYVLNKMRTTSRFVNEIDEDFVERVGAQFENKTRETFPRPKKPMVNRIKKLDTSGIKLKDGVKVVHSIYGDGVVIAVDNGIATIAFMHPHGIKKIVEGHASISLKEGSENWQKKELLN